VAGHVLARATLRTQGEGLKQLASAQGVDLDEWLKDPRGTPYRYEQGLGGRVRAAFTVETPGARRTLPDLRNRAHSCRLRA